MLELRVRFDKRKAEDRAQVCVAKGKLQRALAEYRQIVGHDPADARTWLRIAELCKRVGAEAEAIQGFKQAGQQYRKRGFSARAMASYEQAARLAPGDGAVQVDLGELSLELRHESDALRYFVKAVEVFKERGSSRHALDAQRKVVELAPNDLHQRYRLAVMFATDGMPGEASVQYVELAMNLLRRGDGRRALQVLRPAYEAQPENPRVLEAMALVFAKLGLRERELAVLGERDRVVSLARGAASATPRIARGTSRRAPVGSADKQVGKLFSEATAYIRYGLRDRAIPLLRAILTEQPDHEAARQALQQVLHSNN